MVARKGVGPLAGRVPKGLTKVKGPSRKKDPPKKKAAKKKRRGGAQVPAVGVDQGLLSRGASAGGVSQGRRNVKNSQKRRK